MAEYHSRGGKARAANMAPWDLSDSARIAANARWQRMRANACIPADRQAALAALEIVRQYVAGNPSLEFHVRRLDALREAIEAQ